MLAEFLEDSMGSEAYAARGQVNAVAYFATLGVRHSVFGFKVILAELGKVGQVKSKECGVRFFQGQIKSAKQELLVLFSGGRRTF